MTDDIVTRLREEVMWVRHKTKNQIVPDPLCQEAADEIERLRAETKKTLRQKLRETARERDEWRERYLNAIAGKPIQNVINVTVNSETLDKRFGGDVAAWSQAVADTIKRHWEARRG